MLTERRWDIYPSYSNRVLAQHEALLLAQHDHLTSLATRAALTSFAEHEFSRVNRTKSLVGCLYFDLNKFKAINDNYGHKIGDQVLMLICVYKTDNNS